MRPGTYPVAEVPAAGTDGAAYDSSVSVRAAVRAAGADARRVDDGHRDRGPARGVHVRERPAREPLGRRSARSRRGRRCHGATLDFQLIVTNTGTIAFAADGVQVTDARCDEPPVLGAQADGAGAPDASPGSLDPGDVWTYGCSRATPAPDRDDCAVEGFDNTGRVTVPGAERRRRHRRPQLLCPPPRRPGHRDPEARPRRPPWPARRWSTRSMSPTSGRSRSRPRMWRSAIRRATRRPGSSARFDGSARAPTARRSCSTRRTSGSTAARTARRRPAPDCAPSVVTNTAAVVATSRFLRRRRQRLRRHAAHLPARPAADAAGPAGSRRSTRRATSRSGAGPAAARCGRGRRRNLKPLRRCVRRGTRVVVRGSRIASIRVVHRRPPRRRAGGAARSSAARSCGSSATSRPAATASPRRSASSAARPPRPCGSCARCVCAPPPRLASRAETGPSTAVPRELARHL